MPMMMKRLFWIIPILLIWGNNSAATNAIFTETEPQNETDSIKKVKPLDLRTINFTDDPFAYYLDSLLSYNFFSKDSLAESTMEFLSTDGESLDVYPDFEDDVYKSRIELLNSKTPLELTYTPEVKRYIEVYSKHRREQVSRMMGLAQYYFPMFEEHLDKYNMPLEIKYLAIVESALNPLARSRVGATGLWQFMYATGRMNGLEVNSYIDERHDPVKSTVAACKYLSQLYSIFGDWNLALAAYNSGPGNVNKAIRRSGGKTDYWEIRPYLPRETSSYVPAFIAVNYIMNYASEHKIYPSTVKDSYFNTDTVLIKEQLNFEQISSLVNIDEEDLMFLNPAYRYKLIPKHSEGYPLVLPSSSLGLFVANEDSIYALAKKDFESKIEETAPATVVQQEEKIYHRVNRGEVLGTIAEKYGVSVRSLKRWNNLRGNTIQIGQKLAVYKDVSGTSVATSSADGGSNYVTYKVNSGESFYSIARKYPGVSAENIMEWNKIHNARHLKVGMRLKIYTDI